mgnify:CR=1 FL=1
MSEQLLNCPFCGGKAMLERANDEPGYRVGCARWSECIMDTAHFETREQAIAAWNDRRPSPPDVRPSADGDRVSSNQEAIVEMLGRGIVHAMNAIDKGHPQIARDTLKMIKGFHPEYDFGDFPTIPAPDVRPSVEGVPTQLPTVTYAANAKLAERVKVLEGLLRKHGWCGHCRGKGYWEKPCSLCGDSTYDHECNDEQVPCKECNSTGLIPEVQAALAPQAEAKGER